MKICFYPTLFWFSCLTVLVAEDLLTVGEIRRGSTIPGHPLSCLRLRICLQNPLSPRFSNLMLDLRHARQDEHTGTMAKSENSPHARAKWKLSDSPTQNVISTHQDIDHWRARPTWKEDIYRGAARSLQIAWIWLRNRLVNPTGRPRV